jgi:intein/homing endonuclease
MGGLTRERLYELYWSRGLSLYEIAEMFNRSYSVIHKKFVRFGIPRRRRGEVRKDRRRVIEPKLEPSPELAYVAAVLLGDGYVFERRHHYHIGLKVRSREFAESFAEALTKMGLRPKLRQRKDNGMYVVTAQSRLFYEWFKGLRREEVEELASRFPLDFLRGLYESEGSITAHFNARYNKTYFGVVITNTSEWLISLAQRLINRLGFRTSVGTYRPRSKERYKPFLQLRILGNILDKVKFVELINPRVKRFPLAEEDASNTYRIFKDTSRMVKS